MDQHDSRDVAFRRLYQRHFDAVLGFALRRTDRPEDAADVTAETFLVAWRRGPHVPDGDAARPWLYGVARRVLANHRRGEGRCVALGDRLRQQLSLAMADLSADVRIRRRCRRRRLGAFGRRGAGRLPRSPGFGAGSTAQAESSSTEPSTESPSDEASNTCVLLYDQGSPTPATDAPELAHCDEVVLDEQEPGDLVEEERYQRPPRPVLLTADGWKVDGVDGMGLDWVGPGDAEMHLDWVQAASADPFAYDRYDRAGERIEILGRVGRLTGFVQDGKDYQVLFTSPVSDADPVWFTRPARSGRRTSARWSDRSSG